MGTLDKKPKSPLEEARGAVKQKKLDYLNRAEQSLTKDQWARANTALAAIATAITNRDNLSLQNSVKQFTNMAGGPPFNNDSELFLIGDEIPGLARKYWNLKYPAGSE